MATSETHVDALTVYAVHSFENDRSYQAGLSALYSNGAIDCLSGEAREDFLRRSRVFYFNQAYGCDISESDAKQVEEDRTHAHSTPEVTAIQNQEVSPSIPASEPPKTLTFAELQSLVEQGKTDEIPNNKHIPDSINVVSISHSVLSCLAQDLTIGGRTQPVERPAAPKALGILTAARMTSDAGIGIMVSKGSKNR